MKTLDSNLDDTPDVEVDDGSQFSISVQAAWNDIDKLGHVTNSAYWRWCDDARVQYVMAAGLQEPAPDRPCFVILSATGTFSASMLYRERGIMTCRTIRLGRTSTTTQHSLWLKGGRAFSATFELVLVDQSTGRPTPIPQAFRSSVAALDGLLPG